jgi:hypothetical protein
MKRIATLCLGLSIALTGLAQTSTTPNITSVWTEADRQYLSTNLNRSLDELITETKDLTPEQWNFKESADRWSIAQIVEHIGIWELLMQREISQALSQGPKPELAKDARPDSVGYGFIMEEKKHITNEYTKPFTFAQPLGVMGGPAALQWVTKMRKESIELVNTTDKDLRLHSQMKNRGSVHQVYITTFGHLDRHLRQIRKVKMHAGYPRG